MICNIKNCNKEAKNLAKVPVGNSFYEFQLFDEHFPSFIESYNKEYLRRLVNEMKGNLDKNLDKKLMELDKKIKELDRKLGSGKISEEFANYIEKLNKE